MITSSPYNFSIILPVRNGGEYVKQCVHSILSQTVPAFNLIILDSGSTDGTIAWLQTLKDPRIIIHLAEKPLSITGNWDRIKTIQRNEWMTIIGHDDILSSDYLETMIGLINQYPGASLYQTHFDLIDAEGNFLRKCKEMAAVQHANELLDKILGNAINIYGTGFMMRSKDYDAVGGIPMYPNLLSADYVLWLKLTSLSYKATSKETCFSYRINESTTATTKNDVYISSLKLFVDYLIRSKNELSPNEEQNNYVKRILSFYCKRVSRRLLLSSKKDRDNLSVSNFLKETKAYSGQFMNNGESFNPAAIPDVQLARMIDSLPGARKLFLLLKKIHPNPLMK